MTIFCILKSSGKMNCVFLNVLPDHVNGGACGSLRLAQMLLSVCHQIIVMVMLVGVYNFFFSFSLSQCILNKRLADAPNSHTSRSGLLHRCCILVYIELTELVSQLGCCVMLISRCKYCLLAHVQMNRVNLPPLLCEM